MIRRLSRRAALRSSLGAAALLPTGFGMQAGAQTPWKPTQGVKVIVPAAPGGTTDIVGRLLAAHLQQA